MVEITDIKGDRTFIRDDTITVVIAGSADDPRPFTKVHGSFGSGIEQTKEAAAALVSRLATRLVKLSRPNDTPVWVNAAAVTTLRPPLDIELLTAPRLVRSVIMIGDFYHSLREDVATASRLLGIGGRPASA